MILLKNDKKEVWIMKAIFRITMLMLVLLLLFSVVVAIKSLMNYYALFDLGFVDIEMKYHAYALIYIMQCVMFIVVGVLTLKLFFKIFKGFDFSDANHTKITGIAMCLFIYGVLPNFQALMTIRESYKSVLNTSDMSHALITIIGITILILAAVYEKSQKIKAEHDLTI